ncbi:hypothetical protein AB0F43_00185, partial [Kribbella sp. NPDC023972]|uniref:hypothetical protein n=1 Tax=Kribbella sp. NPDC023972 TaxID=3154795 RepID=UPI0033DEC5F0
MRLNLSFSHRSRTEDLVFLSIRIRRHVEPHCGFGRRGLLWCNGLVNRVGRLGRHHGDLGGEIVLSPVERRGVLGCGMVGRTGRRVTPSGRVKVAPGGPVSDGPLAISSWLVAMLAEPSAGLAEPSAGLVDASAGLVQASAGLVEPSGRLVQASDRLVEPTGRLVQASDRLVQASDRLVQASDRL